MRHCPKGEEQTVRQLQSKSSLYIKYRESNIGFAGFIGLVFPALKTRPGERFHMSHQTSPAVHIAGCSHFAQPKKIEVVKVLTTVGEHSHNEIVV